MSYNLVHSWFYTRMALTAFQEHARCVAREMLEEINTRQVVFYTKVEECCLRFRRGSYADYCVPSPK